MASKVTGFDEFSQKLNDLAKRATELDGSHRVPVSELFAPDFMRRYTEFASIEAMFEASGFGVRSADDFTRISPITSYCFEIVSKMIRT